MGKRVYVPSRGDVVRITLDPQVGHEQRGRRPALVSSPAAYNARVGCWARGPNPRGKGAL